MSEVREGDKQHRHAPSGGGISSFHGKNNLDEAELTPASSSHPFSNFGKVTPQGKSRTQAELASFVMYRLFFHVAVQWIAVALALRTMTAAGVSRVCRRCNNFAYGF